MTPDVNVLVAASRADHSHRMPAYMWLIGAFAATERGARLVLLPMVIAGFIRVVTHRRVFPVPTPPHQAAEFLRVLLEERGATVVELGQEWPDLLRMCRDEGIAGSHMTDPWMAAAVRLHHEHLVTFDRGFQRFLKPSELTVLQP